jgi:lipoprotein-releasing system permease protein
VHKSIFIASRLRFKGKIAIACIAVSFFVMIIASSISSGFRHELSSSISDLSGDVLISSPGMNILSGIDPVDSADSCISYVEESECVAYAMPAVWRAGIVKHGDTVHGVAVKGIPSKDNDSIALGVSIPRKLSQASGLKPGDKMLTYFIDDGLKVRQFNVTDIHDALIEADDRHIVYASLSDMQRLNGWSSSQASAIEVHLKDGLDSEEEIMEASRQIGAIVSLYQESGDLVASSSVSRYPQLFNWLALIDFNVGFILLLMTIAAGFNMISGLLIMLFEHISTIGVLKSMGMTDADVSKVFLASSARFAGIGMLIGNAASLLFCHIQDATHFLKLNPENYYISYVPVKIDLGQILMTDAVSFSVIMLLLLIPCLFISKVDPAQTVRVR